MSKVRAFEHMKHIPGSLKRQTGVFGEKRLVWLGYSDSGVEVRLEPDDV